MVLCLIGINFPHKVTKVIPIFRNLAAVKFAVPMKSLLTLRKPQLITYPLANGVVAFSTTRHGGYSTGAYAEFNITHYCNDDPKAVRKNREALCQLLGIEDNHLILPRQTHGTEVLHIDKAFLALPAEGRQMALEGIDAVITDVPGVCIGISTADCIPVLLYDTKRRIAAAVHAGWRGTVARIVEKALTRMTEWYGTRQQDIVAQIGPGISLASFEVGDEVYEAFQAAGFNMESISRRYEKWHIDLPQCNRLQLLECGVPEQSISLSSICTYQQHDTFFSARRMGIESGRIFTGIMMNSFSDSAAHSS